MRKTSLHGAYLLAGDRGAQIHCHIMNVTCQGMPQRYIVQSGRKEAVLDVSGQEMVTFTQDQSVSQDQNVSSGG